MASQTALDAASWSGRLARPMSLTQRMRFGAGAAAVPQFQVGQLPAAGVGGEAGDPRPVTFDRPQLRAEVRHFAAGDDAGARQPSGQVQQPGQLGHVGAVARFAVAVVGRVHAVSGGRFGAPAGPVKFCVMPCLFGLEGVSGTRLAFDELRRSGVSPSRTSPARNCGMQWSTPTVTLVRGRLPRLAAQSRKWRSSTSDAHIVVSGKVVQPGWASWQVGSQPSSNVPV
jgi:hypothetical protein